MKYSQKMLCRAPFAQQSPMIGDQAGVNILSINDGGRLRMRWQNTYFFKFQVFIDFCKNA